MGEGSVEQSMPVTATARYPLQLENLDAKMIPPICQRSTPNLRAVFRHTRRISAEDVSKELKAKRGWRAAEISPKLWLGDINDATNLTQLQANNITHIVAVGHLATPFPQLMSYLLLNVEDRSEQNIIAEFPKCFSFIKKALSNKENGVLVHCERGVSRSAAVVIGYLMTHQGLTMKQAVELVTDRRPACCPNHGFMQQLMLFEEMKMTLHGDSHAHKKYWSIELKHSLLKLARKRFYSAPNFEQELKSTLALISSRPVLGQTNYVCRSCSTQLLSQSFVIHHDPGLGYSCEKPIEKCDKLFVFPQLWMIPSGTASRDEGLICCPGCSSQIGSFGWTSPAICSCEHRTRPYFALNHDSLSIC